MVTRLAALRARCLRGSDADQAGQRWLLISLQLLYAVLFTAWLFYTHSWPAPDVIALFLLVFALLTARGVAFLRDWSPFIVLLLGYIALTGLVGGLEARAHVGFPIAADRALFFRRVPTIWLQAHLWQPAHLHWYDYASTFLYPLHFVVPLVLAFVLWLWSKPLYWRFVSSYLLLSYAAFITYLLYPMAPPWWAANAGRLPPVHDVLSQVTYGGVSNPVVLATQYFHPNPVAAMPSLHGAAPMLIWLVVWRLWPRWHWLGGAYTLAMGFAIVYLGEHYVVDVLAGWLYALAAFVLVWGGGGRLWRLRKRMTRRGAGVRPFRRWLPRPAFRPLSA